MTNEIMKPYYYLYYVIHNFLLFLGNEGMWAVTLAYSAASALLWLNFMTILYILEISFHTSLLNQGIAVFIFVTIFFISYRIILKNDRYKIILVAAQGMQRKTIKNMAVVLYVLTTFILYFYFADIRRELSV